MFRVWNIFWTDPLLHHIIFSLCHNNLSVEVWGQWKQEKKSRVNMIFCRLQTETVTVCRGRSLQMIEQFGTEKASWMLTTENCFEPSWAQTPNNFWTTWLNVTKLHLVHTGGHFSHFILNLYTKTLKCVYFARFCDIRPADALKPCDFSGCFFTQISMFDTESDWDFFWLQLKSSWQNDP